MKHRVFKTLWVKNTKTV